ncbi:hypothetical protein D3C83_160470 [compost metagenome]
MLPSLTSSAQIAEWMEVGFGLGAIVLAQEANGFDGFVRRLARRAVAGIPATPERRRVSVGRMRPTPGAVAAEARP